MKFTLKHLENINNKVSNRAKFITKDPCITFIQNTVDNSSKPKMKKVVMKIRVRIMDEVVR